jgi:hypothetical protein
VSVGDAGVADASASDDGGEPDATFLGDAGDETTDAGDDTDSDPGNTDVDAGNSTSQTTSSASSSSTTSASSSASSSSSTGSSSAANEDAGAVDGCGPGGPSVSLAASAEVEISGNDCLLIDEANYPVWLAANIKFSSADAPDGFVWPVAFHATQACSDLDLDGELTNEWDEVVIPFSMDCSTYIQLLGEAEQTFEVRWFPAM